jgi:hypothetical protein
MHSGILVAVNFPRNFELKWGGETRKMAKGKVISTSTFFISTVMK